MNHKWPRSEALELMEKVPNVLLSTISAEGFPISRAMLNLRNTAIYPNMKGLYDSDPWIVYLSTNTSSNKTDELKNNPLSCLYFAREQDYIGLTLLGRTTIVNDPSFRRRVWTPEWEEYYAGGIESEDFTMLKFIPQRAKLYRNLQVETWNVL